MFKLKRFFVLISLCLLVSVGLVLALDFPSPVGYVNDFADLIDEDQQQALETRLVALESSSTVELAVVTVTDLQGDTIEEYAVRLFEAWGIGKADKDNGLLILVARDEREARIEVGYGLEPVVTDGRAGRIIRDQMIPAFKEGDYGAGISAAVDQIEGYLSGEITDPEPAPVSADDESAGAIVFFIILFIYAASFLGRTKRVWPGAVLGGVMGWLASSTVGGGGWLVFAFGFFGLLLDIIFSANYKKLKKKGLPTSWHSSWGGFKGTGWSGGRSSGGGFGGFGGGSSGGGGASGSW